MRNKLRTIILTIALMLTTAAHAQVFLLTDEEIDNNKRFNPGTGPVIPYQGGDLDQTLVPLGGGMALLAALGGAYLMGKRRKED